MTGKKWIVLGIVLAAAALLGVTTTQAGPPAQQPEPQGSGEAHIAPQQAPGEPGQAAPTMALGSAFTYQGQLKQGDEPVSGDCEMAFRLYDQATDGTQVGSAITTTVPITGGLFTVSLDFGSAAFTGDARWLGIKVKCPGDGGHTDLGRQELTTAPYALYALGAPWSGLTGVPADLADGDDDTTYTAGNQLSLAGTTFNVVEGSGSDLDADLLDGQHASAFASASHNHDASYWSLTGNAGTNPGVHFLGTTDNQALELKVDNIRALRLEPNATSPNVIGGYSGNSVVAGAVGATISGGGASTGGNQVTSAGADWATISGGRENTANGEYSTVSGGGTNAANNNHATVGGGGANTAGGEHATIGGGLWNTTSTSGATVAGGRSNDASGDYATVPGGRNNAAAGQYSFAAGYRAKANHSGTFVWGDSTNADIHSPITDTFIVRASGGIWFGTTSSPSIPLGRFINTSTGGYLSTGGAWTDASDRNLKESFSPVNGQDVLARLAKVPVTTWNYTAQDPAVRHMGPTAQDFHAAFGLGEDERHIAPLDANGVALAGVQALYRRSQEQAARIEELETENAALRGQLDDLEARVAALEGRPPASAAWPGGWSSLGLGVSALLVGLVLAGRKGMPIWTPGGER